jgi:hypothetical protein
VTSCGVSPLYDSEVIQFIHLFYLGGEDPKMSKDKVPWKLHMKKLERNPYLVLGSFLL